MKLYQDERTALFIDGANLYATAKALQFDIDYRKLLTYFRDRCRLIRALYFTALVDDVEYSPIRPLIDWLDYNGFRVVTKPAKVFTDAAGLRKVKGNMDIEIAIHMMQLVDSLDHVVLFSGDGDFRSLVEAVQNNGRRVSVVSSLATRPAMIADDLRRQADQFVEIGDLKADIGRDPAEREARLRERPAYAAAAPAAAPQGNQSFEDFADL